MRYRSYAQRVKAEQDRTRQQRESVEFNAARIINNYCVAYQELYGKNPQITFVKGWFKIYRTKDRKAYDSFRAKEVISMTSNLLARLHTKQVNEQIDHPELLEDN